MKSAGWGQGWGPAISHPTDERLRLKKRALESQLFSDGNLYHMKTKFPIEINSRLHDICTTICIFIPVSSTRIVSLVRAFAACRVQQASKERGKRVERDGKPTVSVNQRSLVL